MGDDHGNLIFTSVDLNAGVSAALVLDSGVHEIHMAVESGVDYTWRVGGVEIRLPSNADGGVLSIRDPNLADQSVVFVNNEASSHIAGTVQITNRYR